MKKTLQEQYLLIKEGKGHKDVFIKEAKRLFPNMVRNAATFKEASDVLKSKQIIKENVVEIGAINQLPTAKKESYELAFEKFLTEERKQDYFEDEKAELKKVSKQVEDDLGHMYDNKDDKNINNVIFGQVMMGYYAEMKDPKNKDKTAAQLRDIVLKNLAKNPIYYTEKGQFGDLDLGYTVDAPGLGEPKEPKGPHKSSGYGTLSEDHKGNCKTVHPDMSHDDYEASLEENEETQVRTVVKEIIRQELNENVQKRLKAIEEESQSEVLETKAAKIQQEIEMREARMTRLDEDEDMKDLLDKNKIKNLKKEIKVLQKAANKVNKMLDKVNKKKSKFDEPKEEEKEDIIDEGPKEDAEELTTNMQAATDSAGEFKDAIDSIAIEEDESSMKAVADEIDTNYESLIKNDDLTDLDIFKKLIDDVISSNKYKELSDQEKKHIKEYIRIKYGRTGLM